MTMEDGFELLEEKVKKAAELVRRLRKENKDLEGDLAKIKPRLQEAEKKLQDLEKLKGAPAQLESLNHEVKTLQKEREEVRVRIAKLVEVLDGLDA
jgi:chromosome segregation ATPase